MNKQVLDFTIEKTHALMAAPSCCEEAKAAAQAFLDAIGTEKEAEATQMYLKELEADIMPVDGLIGFVSSEQGVQIFGAEQAGVMLAHAQELKTAGAQYCDCPACTAVAAILEKKAELL